MGYPNHNHLLVNPVQISYWATALFNAALVFVMCLVYVQLTDQMLTLVQVTKAMGGTAAILICTSFVLAPASYCFQNIAKYIGYRKYIGLVSFVFVMLYLGLLFITEPERYVFGFFDNLATWDFILGIPAASIYVFMALISNNWALKHLGVKLWRNSLRLGYVALGLLVIRASILDQVEWVAWFNNPTILPPLRMLVSILAVWVIALRLCVAFTNRRKQAQAKPVPSGTMVP